MAATIMMIMMPVIMIRVMIIMIIMIMRAGQPEDPGACSVARARDQAPPQRPSHRHRGRDSESRHGWRHAAFAARAAGSESLAPGVYTGTPGSLSLRLACYVSLRALAA